MNPFKHVCLLGVWTADESRAGPVFSFRHMTGQVHTFWNKALRRYIIPNYGFLNPACARPGKQRPSRRCHAKNTMVAIVSLFLACKSR